MGVGPAMASTSPEGEVRKTPVIQRAALGYISTPSKVYQRFENQYYLINNAAAQ